MTYDAEYNMVSPEWEDELKMGVGIRYKGKKYYSIKHQEYIKKRKVVV